MTKVQVALLSDIHEKQGTGMPNGVVSAPVGTYYTDTAGTAGAWRWLKTSGTGNTGWTVVHGDTGWRDISGLLSPDFELFSQLGECLYRRVGQTVWMSWRIISTTSDAKAVIQVPVEIQPRQYTVLGTSNRGNVQNLGATNRLTLSQSVGSGIFVAASFSYQTKAAWPTTLPGTPA